MKSKIEWTDATWNPVTGCTKVSQGCKNCYAESVAERFWKGRKFTDVQPHADRLDQPLRWRKPRRVFVNSMSDLFHEAVPDLFIDRVFAAMALAPKHAFQVLTKRPERMRAYCDHLTIAKLARAAPTMEFHGTSGEGFLDITVEEHLCDELRGSPILPNVWLGVSCEDQATADERIPLLLDTPAAVRFVSAEPLLGPIALGGSLGGNDWFGSDLDWIIVGGESGSGARECRVPWIESIVLQCRHAGVPCFVKQMGSVPTIEPGRGADNIERSAHEHAQCRRWPPDAHFGNRTGDKNLNGRVALLRDPKGGDPAEWPADLRVREWPKETQLA